MKDNNYALAYTKAIDVEVSAERVTNTARLLPIATGNSGQLDNSLDTIANETGSYAEYTSRGWFHLSLPGLLPRKEKGNAKYIRSVAYAALDKFAQSNGISKFSVPVVLIYQHIYSSKRPDKRYRDHDNIELNVITDLLALYSLSDDGPSTCDHFYTSKVGEKDRTEVYIVPVTDFRHFLEIVGKG